ncbi:hypothetical protein JCM19239_5241 [Vibrio variabilis]|uniref:Uncharacterized protein n=1 Tax=Vibrio variabilis TaxID=990271 RepID=A0ABQ0JD98_9VIBR|nr:hypothetical protein JCM19239_5241 [Vibrio variabilis]
MLLPTFGASARDTDESITTLDDLQSLIDEYEKNPTGDVAKLAEINRLLDQLEATDRLRSLPTLDLQ